MRHPAERTAADVIRHEQAAGQPCDLSLPQLDELAAFSADALLWVTLTRADALRYADADSVFPLEMDMPAYVLATDAAGGLLLFFPDDFTEPAGGAVMADQFEQDPYIGLDTDHARGAYFRVALEIKINQTSGEERDRLSAFREGLDDTHPEVSHVEHTTALGRDVREQTGFMQWPHTPELVGDLLPISSRSSVDIEDDEKRRAGRGSGDTGNPADAALSANIRPEVGSGPAGLETYTTQKSADYEAFPEAMGVSDYIPQRMAEAERGVTADKDLPKEQERREQQAPASFVTLESISADPQNGVDLPIPADASPQLLAAVKSAAQYIAAGEYGLMMEARAGRYLGGWSEEVHAAGEVQPDAHEMNEQNWLDALGRYEDASQRLDAVNSGRGEERFHFPDSDTGEQGPALSAQEAVEAFAQRWDYAVAESSRPDRDFPRAGNDRIIMIAEDGDYIASGNTYVEIADHFVAEGGFTRATLEQANDESTKRQDAERAARAGETLPASTQPELSDYIADRIAQAREDVAATQSRDGEELAVQDHGGGRTPGGGGRGMF